MAFHDTLLDATAADRAELLAIPLLQDALMGRIRRHHYIEFLRQAYHHVRHTVPLLMACGARLDDRHAWLRQSLAHYIEEEIGHQEWILDDLEALGEDRQASAGSPPAPATELMVAYAYDGIARGNPLALFGMVLVLEGSSVALALHAAEAIERTLGLPRRAFSYLRSHGELDREHTQFFADLMDRISDPADQAAIVHAARRFYRLYGNIFRELTPAAAEAA